jgi:hypothetical protein
MDQQLITKDMMAFNKSIFDNTFNMISGIQDQSERMLTSFLDHASWLPDEGKKAITDWVSAYKKGRAEFKAATDEKYEKVTSYFIKKENNEISKMKK